MNEIDRKPFAESMAQLFAMYGAEITTAMMDGWWGVLAPGYTLREVRFAMNAHVQDPERGRFKPVPADIIHHLRTTLPAARAARRAERVRLAREKVAPLEAEMYRLQADIRCGLRPDDHQHMVARINSLAMQITSIQRDAGIDDTPRLDRGPVQLQHVALAETVRRLEQDQ